MSVSNGHTREGPASASGMSASGGMPAWQAGMAPSAPTIYPASPPVEEMIDRFWETGPEFEAVQIRIEPPERPLALLETLGPSPFERGGFPLIGFLATTYDKVGRYALERR